MSTHLEILKSMATIVNDYTAKLPGGKNIITQTFGNNTCQAFDIAMGKVNLSIKTPSMPARLEVKESLTSGKFNTDKSKSKNYYSWLIDGILPPQEVAYLTGYLFLSQLSGSGLSLISGVRATMLDTILNNTPKDIKITITTMVNNGGNDLPVTFDRDNIVQLVKATMPRATSLQNENRKHAKNTTLKPAEVKGFEEVSLW